MRSRGAAACTGARGFIHRFTCRLARHLVHGALDLVYPPRCAGCNARGRRETPLMCAACAMALAGGAVRDSVGRGDDRTGAIPLLALGWMEGSLQNFIHALKYQRVSALAPILGSPLGSMVSGGGGFAGRDVLLVPVPLDPARERERGFNQSELLARAVARESGLAAAPGWLRKRRATGSQTALDRERRRTNLRDSMEAAPGVSFRGRRAILVDDVATTGATIVEAARAVRVAGGEVVGALVIARTPAPRQSS